jgi:hypothetical protein
VQVTGVYHSLLRQWPERRRVPVREAIETPDARVA